MTEDEAKTKWCPFARGRLVRWEKTSDTVQNTLWGAEPQLHCIASACMAWRTRRQWFDNAQQEPEWVSYAPYAFEPGEGQEREDGYCGLAGPVQ